MKAILKSCSKELPLCAKYIKNHFSLSDNENDINAILKNAVEFTELQTGLSLRRKTWTIIHDNHFISLIYGPIIQIVAIHDSNGNEVKPISIKRAHDNLSIQFAEEIGVIKITYEAGYDRTNLPECLKYSILEKFWEIYSQYSENKEQDCLQDMEYSYNHIGASHG